MSKITRNKLIALGFMTTLATSSAYLIIPNEGKENKAYLDPLNIWTVCYGHTKKVDKNKVYSNEECYNLLANDLKEHNDILLRNVKVPLTEYQHAAFLSFIYNVGPGKKGVKDGFVVLKNGNQSSMLRKLNQGDYKGACDQFLKWMQLNKGLGGIAKRRKMEREMCLGNIKII